MNITITCVICIKKKIYLRFSVLLLLLFFFFFFFLQFRCYDLVIIFEQLLLVTEVVNGAFLTSLTHSKLTDENFLYCYWAHIIFVVDSVFNY